MRNFQGDQHRTKTFVRRLRFLILLPLLGLALAACVIPGASTPAPQDTQEPAQPTQANPAYTAAAQTIIAQLTAVAPTGTLQPSASPAARDTLTSTPESSAEIPVTETPTGGDAASGGEFASTAEPPTQPTNPTLENTPTAEPATPTIAPPSPTIASNDPRARLGEPDWSDPFANANYWPLFEDDHVHFTLKDGNLQLLAKKPEKWDGWMLSWTTLYNFYLEVTASPQNCSGADRYGLLARAPSAEKAYLFGLTCDGQYSLRKWNGERFSYLVDWTKSDLIKSGAGKTNRLGFMASDNQISLYVNGELLTEITDRSYDNGAFGLFVSSANTENFKVLVSEVAYWELP